MAGRAAGTAAPVRDGRRAMSDANAPDPSALRRARASGRVGEALVCGGVGLASLVLILFPPERVEGRSADAFGILLLLVASGALWWRRSRPLAVLVVVIALVVAYQTMEYPPDAAFPSALVALYSVAATGRRWRTVLVAAGTVALVIVTRNLSEGGGLSIAEMADPIGWVLLGLAVGEAVRYHRAYRDQVDARASEQLRVREQELAHRLTSERLEMARDLHDVLAHGMTAIAVQAGTAAHLLHDGRAVSADEARVLRDMLEEIASTGRRSSADLKAALQSLRDGSTDRMTTLASPPGLASLPDLIEPLRAAGVEVRVTTTGPERPLPPVHDVAVYRIVQEALTNAVKHGRSAAVALTLAYTPDGLEVLVRDEGPADRPPADLPAGEPGEAGHGLLGMAERAAAVGGVVVAGPEGRGFAVRVELPLPAAAPGTVLGQRADA